MNKSFINIQQTEYYDINTAMHNNYIAENYEFPVSDLGLPKENAQKFCDALKEKYDINVYEFEISTFKTSIFYEEKNKDFLVFLTKYPDTVHVDFYTQTIDKSKEIFDLFSEFKKKNEDIVINYYSATLAPSGKVTTSLKQMNIKDFKNIKEGYYPYIDTELMFHQFFKVKESIMVLLGDPGLGKTKLISQSIKYLVNNVADLPSPDKMYDSVNILYVKNDDVIVNDSFWNMLEEDEYHLVILDDLDFYLNKRVKAVDNALDEKRNKFINYFLSFTDGVTDNNVKFVITSNKNYDDVDSAILRKGRTFDILNLRKLKYEEALNIWLEEEFKEEEFTKIFSREETIKNDGILPADLGHEINVKKSLQADKNKDYVKEEGISIYNSFKENKTTGYDL